MLHLECFLLRINEYFGLVVGSSACSVEDSWGTEHSSSFTVLRTASLALLLMEESSESSLSSEGAIFLLLAGPRLNFRFLCGFFVVSEFSLISFSGVTISSNFLFLCQECDLFITGINTSLWSQRKIAC